MYYNIIIICVLILWDFVFRFWFPLWVWVGPFNSDFVWATRPFATTWSRFPYINPYFIGTIFTTAWIRRASWALANVSHLVADWIILKILQLIFIVISVLVLVSNSSHFVANWLFYKRLQLILMVIFVLTISKTVEHAHNPFSHECCGFWGAHNVFDVTDSSALNLDSHFI